MSTAKRPQSISPSRFRFRVAASPFNAVKLDIIIIGSVGVLATVWLERTDIASSAQLALLAAYGVVGALWVTVRARRILNRHLQRNASAVQTPAAEDVSPNHGQD